MSSNTGSLDLIIGHKHYFSYLLNSNNLYNETISSVNQEEFYVFSTIRYDPSFCENIPKNFNSIEETSFFLFKFHFERLFLSLKYYTSKIKKNTNSNLHFEFNSDFFLFNLKQAIRAYNKDINNPLRIKFMINIDGDLKINVFDTKIINKEFFLLNKKKSFDQVCFFDVWNIYLDTQSTEFSYLSFFKTTNRSVYDNARLRTLPNLKPDLEEVLLYDKDGFLVEGSITNFAIKRISDNKWITPPLSLRCLFGVMRRFLLEKNYIIEEKIHLNNLNSKTEIVLFNSLRGIFKGKIVLKNQ